MESEEVDSVVDATAADLGDNTSHFHRLVSDLQAAYDRDILLLRAEIASLRKFAGDDAPAAHEVRARFESYPSEACLSSHAGCHSDPPQRQPASSGSLPSVGYAYSQQATLPPAVSQAVSEASRVSHHLVSVDAPFKYKSTLDSSHHLRSFQGSKVSDVFEEFVEPTIWEYIAQAMDRCFAKFRRPRKCVHCIADSLRWFANLKEPERSGWLAQTVDGNTFNAICFVVIVLNSVYIWHQSDRDMYTVLHSDVSINTEGTVQPEVAFALFYLSELLAKLAVHRLYFFVNSDWKWNIFDITLTSLAAIELRVFFSEHLSKGPNVTFLRLLRILKIVKILRVMRTVRFVLQLRLMLEMLLYSFVHVFWWLLLIMLILFLFALIFVQAFVNYAEQEPDQSTLDRITTDFGSVHLAMVSLLQATTGGVDWQEHYFEVGKAGGLFQFIYLLFVLFFVMAVWNLVTSAFVERTFKFALPDIEAVIMDKHRRDSLYMKELTQLLNSKMGPECNGRITISDFTRWISDPKLMEFFSVRGLDVKDTRSFFRMLQCIGHSDDSVELRTFVRAAVRLQGGATSIDLQTLHFDLRNLFTKQADALQRIERVVAQVRQQTPFLEGVDFRRTTTPGSELQCDVVDAKNMLSV